ASGAPPASGTSALRPSSDTAGSSPAAITSSPGGSISTTSPAGISRACPSRRPNGIRNVSAAAAYFAMRSTGSTSSPGPGSPRSQTASGPWVLRAPSSRGAPSPPGGSPISGGLPRRRAGRVTLPPMPLDWKRYIGDFGVAPGGPELHSPELWSYTVSNPSGVRSVRSMLTIWELALLYHLARDHYTGAGAIV